MIQEFAIDLVYKKGDKVVFEDEFYTFLGGESDFSQWVYPTQGKGWVLC